MTETELWQRLEAEVRDAEWDKATVTATLFAERGWGPSVLLWWVKEGRRHFPITFVPDKGWRMQVVGFGTAEGYRSQLEDALWRVKFLTDAIGAVAQRYQ